MAKKKKGDLQYDFQFFPFDFVLLLFITVVLSLSRLVSLQETEPIKIAHILTTTGTVNFAS